MKKIIAIAALSCVALNASGCISPDVLLQANQIMQNAPTGAEEQTTETVTEKETPKPEPVTVDELVQKMDIFEGNCYYDLSFNIGYELSKDGTSIGEEEVRVDVTQIKYDKTVYSESKLTQIIRNEMFGRSDDIEIKVYNVTKDDGTVYEVFWTTGVDEWSVYKINEEHISGNDNFLVYNENHFKDAYIEETDDCYIIKNVASNDYINELVTEMAFCGYEECSEKIKVTTSIYFDKRTKEVKEIVAEMNFALLNAHHWNIGMHYENMKYYEKYLPAKLVVNNIKERTKEIPLPTSVELK